MRKLNLAARLLTFRNELAVLWRAFLDPTTPLWLKAAMLGVVAYLISPIDLIPEFLPLLGIVDDLVLVPLMVSWIAKRVPQAAKARSGRSSAGGPTIDGTWRRL